jgi:hypothetical protein
MEKLIACCGLDCATCDARIATLADNYEMRVQVVEKWKIQHNAVGITPEMINCTGCTEPGVKYHHCEQCTIRSCANTKGYNTCADCDQMESCAMLNKIHQYVPEALVNLKSQQ